MELEWNPIRNGWNQNGIQFIMDGTGLEPEQNPIRNGQNRNGTRTEPEWNPIHNGWNWNGTGMESNL